MVLKKKIFFEEILMNYFDKKIIFDNNIILRVLIILREDLKRNLYFGIVGY